MNIVRIIFAFSFSAFLFFSCNEPTNPIRNIKDYYFPVENLDQGLVYEYEATEDTRNPPFYYYYRTVRNAADLYLTGTYYDYDFTPQQFVREELTSNGMTLADFYFYSTDTLTGKQNQVPVEIEAKNVFPFTVNEEKPGVLLFTIKWTEPDTTQTELTLIRNRQFAGDTTYIYQGKEHEAVQFYVRELIDNNNQGHLETEYDGLEIYAKDLGLVYFEKNVSKEFIIKYKLKDTYPMTTLEEKFKNRQKEE